MIESRMAQIGRIRSPPHRAGSARPMGRSGAGVPRCCGPLFSDIQHFWPTGRSVGKGVRTGISWRPTRKLRRQPACKGHRGDRTTCGCCRGSRFQPGQNKMQVGVHRGLVWGPIRLPYAVPLMRNSVASGRIRRQKVDPGSGGGGGTIGAIWRRCTAARWR